MTEFSYLVQCKEKNATANVEWFRKQLECHNNKILDKNNKSKTNMELLDRFRLYQMNWPEETLTFLFKEFNIFEGCPELAENIGWTEEVKTKCLKCKTLLGASSICWENYDPYVPLKILDYWRKKEMWIRLEGLAHNERKTLQELVDKKLEVEVRSSDCHDPPQLQHLDDFLKTRLEQQLNEIGMSLENLKDQNICHADHSELKQKKQYHTIITKAGSSLIFFVQRDIS